MTTSYHGARKLHRYLLKRWDKDIKDSGDGPLLFGKEKWEQIGLGGGDGAGIIWEGFYEWTRDSELDKMQALLKGSGLQVFPTARWMLEVF